MRRSAGRSRSPANEIEDQFATRTYALHEGRLVCSKGNDHIIDAVRCAMPAREQAHLDIVGEETSSLSSLAAETVFIRSSEFPLPFRLKSDMLTPLKNKWKRFVWRPK